MNNWFKQHDNKISFALIYVALSFYLSIAISLFWLFPIIVAHGLLEYSILEPATPLRKIKKILIHLNLDIVLIIFALWLAVYFESIFGLLGLSAGARATAQGGARFLAWQKTIKGVLMTADDAVQLAKGALSIRANSEKSDKKDDEYRLNKTGVALFFIGLLLANAIIFAPFFIDITYPAMLEILKSELNPWP